MPSQIFQDTFTDTDSTLITAHTGEGGVTWTRNAAVSAGCQFDIQLNALRPQNQTTILFHPSPVPPSADQAIEGDFIAILNRSVRQDTMALLARSLTSAQTGYAGRYNTATGAWELVLLNAGAATLLGSYTDAVPSNGTRLARLEVAGQGAAATQKLYIDGTLRISGTDATLSAAGRFGLRSTFSGALGAPSVTDGLRWDAVRGYDLTPFVTFPPLLGRRNHGVHAPAPTILR